MSLAARFKARRLELGMTQVEVANSAGVSQQSIESIESGRTRKPRNLLDLAKALKCSPDWLLNGKNIMPLAEISTRRIPILSYVQAGELTEARDITDLTGELNIFWQTLTFQKHASHYVSMATACNQSLKKETLLSSILIYVLHQGVCCRQKRRSRSYI